MNINGWVSVRFDKKNKKQTGGMYFYTTMLYECTTAFLRVVPSKEAITWVAQTATNIPAYISPSNLHFDTTGPSFPTFAAIH
ncbi:hypothetical protein POVWA2_021090 [Plasmodium ovale wallikeri]|uniref:Uncharacterized protein n=1 Tax=Plasmodium ovale wallikeri TaxID=864142 RepID=A0A1A8YRT4_PLAOA|nr:hypothetical protein POVWA1_021110 [Plasmodium ovale wallikeri]SBT34683.1 hypothetical protein POVWA2_021090 [Plasmodium ovale wallikeri]